MAVSVIYEIADVLKIKTDRGGYFCDGTRWHFHMLIKQINSAQSWQKCLLTNNVLFVDDWWLKLLAVILVNSHYLCLDECRFLHTSLIIRCLWKPEALAWHSIQATFVRLKREQMKNKNMVWIIHDVHFWPWVIQRGHNPWENNGLLCTNTLMRYTSSSHYGMTVIIRKTLSEMKGTLVF